MNRILILIFVTLFCYIPFSKAHSVKEQIKLIEKVKKSTVGVGLYNPLNAPRYQLRGTGFVVRSRAGKSLIATNHHVVNGEGFDKDKSQISVHVGEGKNAKFYTAKLIKQNARTDVAIIEIRAALPPLTLVGKNEQSPAGTEIILSVNRIE